MNLISLKKEAKCIDVPLIYSTLYRQRGPLYEDHLFFLEFDA